VDFWVYAPSYGVVCKMFADGDGNGTAAESLVIGSNEINGIHAYSQGKTASVLESGALTTNTWAHVAVVQNNGAFYLFINGQLKSQTTVSGMQAGNGSWAIGGTPTGNNLCTNTYMDEFRITAGVARWTSAFTPPTAPTSVPVASIGSFDANVVSLLHFDGNMTDEKGKTWAQYGSVLTSTAKSQFG